MPRLQIQTGGVYILAPKLIIGMSYWDIDNFLAEEQKIQCSFTTEAPGMQFLDPSKGNSGNIEANQQIQVSIWILNVINDYMPQIQERNSFKVKFPGYLHSKEFERRVLSFEVDSHSSTLERVNLDRESPYLYEHYLLLIKLMEHQKTNFDKELIAKTLRKRGKYILIRASNYIGNVNIDAALNRYTQFEDKIYRRTKKILEDFNAWKYSHLWLNKSNSLQKNTIK